MPFWLHPSFPSPRLTTGGDRTPRAHPWLDDPPSLCHPFFRSHPQRCAPSRWIHSQLDVTLSRWWLDVALLLHPISWAPLIGLAGEVGVLIQSLSQGAPRRGRVAGGWTSPLIRGCTAPRWDRMDLRSKRQISTNQRGGTKRLAWWLRGDLVIPSRVVAHRCMTRAIHDPNAKRRVPKRSRNQPTGDPQGDVEKPLRAWFFPLLFHQGSDGWVGVSRSRPPRTPSCGYPNEPIIPAEDFRIP